MRDCITAQERLNLMPPPLVNYKIHQCSGCGKLSANIVIQSLIHDDDFDSNSRTTNCGLWYCNTDCFRASG